MNVYLFIPCLVEDCYPRIGLAAAEVLEKAGCTVTYPEGQTCCGQMLYKQGHRDQLKAVAKRMVKLFSPAEAVVLPSGSCTAMIRKYPTLFRDKESGMRVRTENLASKTFELGEFLVRVLGKDDLGAEFNAKAVYHDSCQIGRALGLKDEPRRLLAKVKGLEMLPLDREDQCCGFGGTFSLQFPSVSTAVLEEKIASILTAQPDVVITAEVSCLMNIRGYLKKHKYSVKAVHLAEVLAGWSPWSEE